MYSLTFYSSCHEMNLGVTIPSLSFDPVIPVRVCPDDGVPWDSHGCCPKCGLEQAEVDTLLAVACSEYDQARELALQARYSEAQRGIQAARSLGLRHEALYRLETLCAAVSGNWERISPEVLPVAWQETLLQAELSLTALAEMYRKASEAAQSARWTEAVSISEAILNAAPWLLPAYKLYILSLQGAGRTEDALRVCRTGLEDLPEEPDLTRWQRELATDLAGHAPAPLPAIVPIAQAKPRIVALGFIGTGLTIFALLLGFAVGRHGKPISAPGVILRSTPVPMPAPQLLMVRPAHVPIADPAIIYAPADAVISLPDDLQRQLVHSRHRADLHQARRWLRTANRAYTLHHYGVAAHLASAAVRMGQGSRIVRPARRLLARALEQGNQFSPARNP
jgi:tetratricopeptide (TPR) repeat protein